jgi:hypothetical protein
VAGGRLGSVRHGRRSGCGRPNRAPVRRGPIRIDVIARSKELRNRAAQTLSLFFTVLLIAIVLDAVAPNAVTALLLFIAGVLVAVGVHAGLYVTVLPVITALAGGVTSAWLLLTKVPAGD